MDRQKIIGENLKRARGTRSCEEIAKRADISVSAVRMYESGERIPRDEVKIRLSRVLGVSLVELFYPDVFFKH